MNDLISLQQQQQQQDINFASPNELFMKLIPILITIFNTIMKVANATFPELNKLIIEIINGINKLKNKNADLIANFNSMNGTTIENTGSISNADFFKILFDNLPLIISIIMKIFNIASDQVGEIVKAVIEALSGVNGANGNNLNLNLNLGNLKTEDFVNQTIYHLK
ncbi:unnamed protein product [Candida verbasci]|uniref:Uncharacterized protein n=1 Tax=Candida verbasci TaxID=1227364 RepID=A0A9W4U240_9ASCO|nr:unnamed protein product [Candida verbasci]